MKKRKKRSVLRSIVLGIVLGIVALQFEESYLVQSVIMGRYLEFYGVTLAALAASLLVHTIIHELGHLIFGLLTGYRFSSFRVGSLMLMTEQGRLVLRRHSIPGTAGQCLMAPPALRDGRMPVVLYNLGGSIANLIASIPLLLLALTVPIGSVWAYIWGLVASVGVTSALTNAIPNGNGMVFNDGYNARSLLRDVQAVRAVWIQLEVNHRQSQGERIADMPADWFAMPTEAQMQNNLTAALAVLHADRILAEERLEEADVLMAELIAGENAIAPIHRSLLQMQRLWLEVMQQNRPEVVKELLTDDLKQLMKAMKRYPPVIRMEYALAMLQDRDERQAEKCLRRFEKAAKRYAYRVQIADERKALEAIREKAKELS